MRQKVVARFMREDRIVKGYTHDFFPTKDTFHLEHHDAQPDTFPEIVVVQDLKAIFFVKSFEGDETYQDKDKFNPQKRPGRRVEVEFADGERVQAYCESYHPTRQGFIVFPLDEESNNDKIFVVNSAVKKVEFVD
jgi:hypothetical protein